MKIVESKWANYSDIKSKFYKSIIEKYKIIPWSRQFEYPFVIENNNFPSKKGFKILEAGALGSIIPSIFAEYSDYHALDIGSEIINTYKNCKCFHNDLCKTPFESNYFDVILCVSVFEHMPEGKWKDALIEFERILKPGCRAIITLDVAYTPKCPFNFKYSEMEKFFSFLNGKLPEKPKDILSSDDSIDGRTAGPGLQVLSMILEK